MNKKLLTAAIAAVFAAPMAASADATVYGGIHVQTVATDAEAGGAKTIDNWSQSLPDAALGIKGSEDLGNGLKALYKIEMDIDTYTDASQSDATMTDLDEIWVGFTGDWGTALLGQEDTPYKTFQDMVGVDALGDSIVDIDGNIGGSVDYAGFERFTGRGVIAYVSPNFSGFSFGAAVVTGGQTDVATATANNNPGIAEHYSLGANYKAGGLSVGAGFESKVRLVEAAGTPEWDQEQWFVGAGYTFGDFKVAAKYEEEEGVSGAAGANGAVFENDDAERFAVSGTYTLGNNRLGLVYFDEEFTADPTGINYDYDADGFGVFGEHNLSGRTKVYAAYAAAESDAALAANDKEDDRFSIGVVHSF